MPSCECSLDTSMEHDSQAMKICFKPRRPPVSPRVHPISKEVVVLRHHSMYIHVYSMSTLRPPVVVWKYIIGLFHGRVLNSWVWKCLRLARHVGPWTHCGSTWCTRRSEIGRQRDIQSAPRVSKDVLRAPCPLQSEKTFVRRTSDNTRHKTHNYCGKMR